MMRAAPFCPSWILVGVLMAMRAARPGHCPHVTLTLPRGAAVRSDAAALEELRAIGAEMAALAAERAGSRS